MPYISKFGTPEQIEKFIPPMVSGHCISAIAMTEPGAGSDLQGIRTNAKRDGDDWILNGSKTFITNGWLADMVIVVAITNPEAKKAAHGISLFLIEDGMEGFNKGKILNKVGLKGQFIYRVKMLLYMWEYSSGVEHSTADREVPGSIPGVPLLFSLQARTPPSSSSMMSASQAARSWVARPASTVASAC